MRTKNLNPEISIIIPTYNERKNILKLLATIIIILKNYSFEVIVIDDYSPDGTAAAVREQYKHVQNITVQLHPPPAELSAAILQGIAVAKGRLIIGMDADYNHDPTVLPVIIKQLQSADLVVASRFIAGGGMENRTRWLGSYFFNKLLTLLFDFPVTDNTSGYYGVHTRKLQQLPLTQIYSGYGEYHLRLVYLAKKAGFKISEVAVMYKKRAYGESKSKFLKMLVKYFWVAFRLRFTSYSNSERYSP